MAYGIPKLLKTRKDIATKPGELADESSEFGVKASSMTDEVKNLAGNAITGTKNLVTGLATNPSTAPYTGIAESPSEVPVSGIFPGGLWPAYAAALPAGIIGGASLANWLTNKTRKQMLDRKKHQLQTQFSTLLSGTPKTASARMLDYMADEYCTEKKAWGAGATGLLITALGLSGLAGWEGGRAAGKRINPDYTKRQEIEKALKTKSKSQPITFNVDPTTDREEFAAGPKPVSQLANEEYRLPMVLPNRRKNMLPEHDEALDFGKLSSLRKAAGWRDYVPQAAKNLYHNATADYGGAVKGLQQGMQQMQGNVNQITQEVRPAIQDFRTTTKNIGQAVSDIGAPFRYLGNAARGFRDYMKPLSSMLMSGLAGLPQMAANGLHSMGIGQAAQGTPQAPAIAATKPAVTPTQPAVAPVTAPVGASQVPPTPQSQIPGVVQNQLQAPAPVTGPRINPSEPFKTGDAAAMIAPRK